MMVLFPTRERQDVMVKWNHAPRVELDAKVEEAEAALVDAVHGAFEDLDCPTIITQALADALELLRDARNMIPRV